MSLRKYCDACREEINNEGSIRPAIDITWYGTDLSPMRRIELCDACYMAMRNWLEGFLHVGGHKQVTG